MMVRYCILAALATIVAANSLHADDVENGGQKLVGKPAPPLSFTAYNSRLHVDLADLRGKMVVIDFFECEKSTDSSGFDDLADVEHAKAAKGVVVLGVSADVNPSAITSLLKKKSNIDWPIDYDPTGFSGNTCQVWQESRKVGANLYSSFFHLVYIVSPEGTVVWTGLPDQVDRAVTEQLKDHPPTIVNAAVMADATAALAKMQAALKKDDLAAARKQRSLIPDTALADDDFAAKVKSEEARMDEADDAALKSIDELLASKNFVDAAAKLKSLQSIDDDSVFAKSIKSRTVALKRNSQVTTALAGVPKLKPAPLHPSTATSGPATQPSADSTRIRAQGLLHLADSYRENGNLEKAREKYEAVLKQFPDTDEARTAQAELAKLPR